LLLDQLAARFRVRLKRAGRKANVRTLHHSRDSGADGVMILVDGDVGKVSNRRLAVDHVLLDRVLDDTVRDRDAAVRPYDRPVIFLRWIWH